MMMSSPRSSYHIVVCCGSASGPTVASTANRGSARNWRVASRSAIMSCSTLLSARGSAARPAAPLLPRALTASRRLSARGTDQFHRGNDLTANEVEEVRIRYIGRVEDRLIDSHLGQMLAVLDRGCRRHRVVGAVA